MSAGIVATVMSAVSNCSREPVREDEVAAIMMTGDGRGHWYEPCSETARRRRWTDSARRSG